LSSEVFDLFTRKIYLSEARLTEKSFVPIPDFYAAIQPAFVIAWVAVGLARNINEVGIEIKRL